MPFTQDALLTMYKVASGIRPLERRVLRDVYATAYTSYKRIYEARDYATIVSRVRPGSGVIDAGANIGFYTRLFAKQTGSTGKVIAIEPDVVNFTMLQRSLRRGSVAQQCVLVNGAVDKADGSGFLAIDRHHPANHRLAEVGSPVRLHAIDSLVDTYLAPEDLPVTLIKLDIQGAELNALEGAARTIEKHRPAIALEIDAPCLAEFGTSASEIWNLLSEIDYVAALPTRDLDPRSAFEYGDVVVVPRESYPHPVRSA